MQDKLLDAIQEAVLEIASTMLFLEITPLQREACTPNAHAEISAIVGFSGGINGSLRLAGMSSAAIKLASALAGEPLASLDNTTLDAFAELANMTAGGMQTRLSSDLGTINITPPVVVTGQEHRVSGDKHEQCARHLFQLEDEPFFVEILYRNK